MTGRTDDRHGAALARPGYDEDAVQAFLALIGRFEGGLRHGRYLVTLERRGRAPGEAVLVLRSADHPAPTGRLELYPVADEGRSGVWVVGPLRIEDTLGARTPRPRP